MALDPSRDVEEIPGLDDLADAVLTVRTRDEARRFLRDLCTLPELEALTHRWQTAKLLEQHVPYVEIAERVPTSTATVTREVDFGRQTLTMPLPAVVTADLRLNEPRNVGLPMVMKAKSKPLATKAVAGLGIDITPRLIVEKVTPPRERTQGRVVATAAEFAAAIAAEVAKMEPR